jgi:hypothetical protein
MISHRSMLRGIVAFAAIVAAVPALAQQPEDARVPTKKDPIRFRAFAVNMQAGMSGVVDLVIERWTTEAEREMLLAKVATATDRPGGQDELVNALQGIATRTGYIKTSNSLGWDLKYAWQNELADGVRQLVIATDKPISFFAAARNTRSLDYPFSLLDIRFPAGGGKGEGKLLANSAISTEGGKLHIELYGQEATRLTNVEEKAGKKKKK